MDKQTMLTGDPASDRIQLYDRLERISRTGWCLSDFNQQAYIFSDYLSEMFEVPDGRLYFSDCMPRVHPDDLYRVDRGTEAWSRTGSYDEVYPVMVKGEYIWIRVKIGAGEKDARGHDVATGTIQLLEPKDYAQYDDNSQNVQLSELLNSQNYISKLLLRLLQDPDIDTIINEILANIIDKFGADRSYIFSFDLVARTHSCVYEVTKVGVTSEMDDLQNWPIDASPWWCNHLLENKSHIIEDVKVLDGPHPVEYEVLSQQDIKSLMVVPLLNGEGVWGYLGVDIVERYRTWSETEQQWLKAITNYISVCLELHNAVEKANRSGETMRNIYRNLPLSISVYDADGRLQELNDVAVQTFGISDPAAMIGKDIFDHPLLSPQSKQALEEGRGFEADITYDFGDEARDYYSSNQAGRKEFYLKATILFDAHDKPDHYVIMIIDNTAKVQTYNKMIEAERLFRSVSDFAEVGFCRLDVAKQEFFATPQFYKNMSLNELESSDITVHKSDYYEVMQPEDAAEFSLQMTQLAAGSKSSFTQEMRIKDGQGWRWLRCVNMVTEYEPENGNVVITGMNINITETKLIEQRLVEAKLKAEQSDKVKSAFLANMSHEIRTPLNAIVGFSNLISETEDPADRAQFLAIIQQNNDHLLQLIADILDLSKIEAGVLDVTYSDVDINDLCSNIVSSIDMKTPEGVVMSFEAGLPDCRMRTDRSRLTQVLMNYLGNAVKFTSEGFIKLDYKVDGNFIEFSVTDSGMGMTAEQAENVFGRFVKFNQFVQGTGLGLSICKSIAEKMDGDVGVDSQPGKGSRFWIRLPYEKAGQEPSVAFLSGFSSPTAADIPAAKLHEGRKKVLIAEDKESNAVLMAKALEGDYETLIATTGPQAYELYGIHKPDLILMDIKMPELDGLEVTAAIRENDLLTPIIAITAYAYESDRQRAFEAGCNEFVAKPIVPDALRKLVRNYIL